MFNPDQAATDLTNLLLSSDALKHVNIVKYRTLRLQNMVDFSSLMTTPRNGRYGAAIVVLEPYAQWKQNNLLVLDWVFPIVSIECPEINDQQNGSNLSAYRMAQYVADEIHLFSDPNIGRFRVSNPAIEDESVFVIDGCVEKKISFNVVGINSQTSRTGNITMTVDGSSVVSLSCPNDPTAPIYYTLDGSFPAGMNGGNALSYLYTEPFQGQSGQVVRSRAYADGKIGSATTTRIIP